MNFRDLIRRADNTQKSFEELEADLADAVDECLGLEDLSRLENDTVPGEAPPEQDDNAQTEHDASTLEYARRLTSHTQSRMAALSSFDGLFHDAKLHFEEIDAKLSEIASTHHLTREFFHILHADILRANELELTNLSLTADQRVLSDKLNDLSRRQHERESIIETLQQRDASLVQDSEALRGALAAARLELVEAANTTAKKEAEFGDLTNTLAAVTVEADRRARENKLLREKNVNLSIDLEKALKREDEARHRLDEFSTMHANEAARNSEVLGALGKSEKEATRLHTSLEVTQAKLAQVTEAARIMEGDKAAELERCRAEIRGLRSEIQNLHSRLELTSSANNEASNEIAKLKLQWSEAVAEKQVADERLAALTKETEADKFNLSKITANFSQLSLQQASDEIQLDIRRQECEDLRAEIASVNARIRELLPYERLHRVTNAVQHESGVAAAPMMAERTARAARRVRRGAHSAS
jgi:chromosome segregation ATPase